MVTGPTFFSLDNTLKVFLHCPIAEQYEATITKYSCIFIMITIVKSYL